ncbi:hypothetical protein [Rhodococcus maanshanensis]|uniref:PH domain-containing protein n=1 Tax=Rhodococcus maanshanensis TaxID=183556 RepID=A0A1H7F6U4_9NOCA|nr:hypothetical protein [Rhodococcus maanshanensis]SEK21823.1 hypothetical protein SAMN05444583_10183 [Rhodococcus maanshanensis]
MIASVWMWIRGEVDDRHGQAAGFGYTKGTFVLPFAFMVAGLIEAVAIHLLVPWQWLRVTLLIATVVSLAMVVGWLAGRVVHPHLITEDELVLRSGSAVLATVDLAVIGAARLVRRFDRTDEELRDGRLYLPGPDGTVLDIDFRGGIPITFRRGEPTEITGVSLHVDDPQAMLARLRALTT